MSKLILIDFWLWEYLKPRVYAFNPQTVSDLKDAIRREIQQIPHDTARVLVLSNTSHLSHAKCHHCWKRFYRKFVKPNKMFSFLLYLCPCFFFLFCFFLIFFFFLLSHSNVGSFHSTGTITIFIGFCYRDHIPILKMRIAINAVQIFDDIMFFAMRFQNKTQFFVYAFSHHFFFYRCRSTAIYDLSLHRSFCDSKQWMLTFEILSL